MNIKFFGQYLLEKGLINRKQLLKTLKKQKELSPVLGELAIERKWINERQANQINIEQRRQDKRFGEIAMSLKLLDNGQVNDLLVEQKRRRKYFGEILVELGYLDADVLAQELVGHKNEVQALSNEISITFSTSDMGDIGKLASDIYTRYYQRMLKTSVSILNVSMMTSEEDGVNMYWSQRLEGEQSFQVVLGMQSSHARFVASNVLNEDVYEIDELAIDAVCEYLNIYVGHLYSSMNENRNLKVYPPVFHDKAAEFSLESCNTICFDSGEYINYLTIGEVE